MLTRYSSIRGLLDNPEDSGQISKFNHDLIGKISYAFQLASAHGPLCSEALQGVAVFLEDFELSAKAEGIETSVESSGRLIGEIIRSVRDFIRQGFLDWSPRMLLAMYKCEIQASSESNVEVFVEIRC